MKNCYKQLTTVLIFLFVISIQELKAQQPTLQEANYVHDRMYNLITKSTAVILPENITNQLENINRENPNKQKFIFGQSSLIKVMYNTTLTKDDRIFFGKQVLQSKSALYISIQHLVEEKMKNL